GDCADDVDADAREPRGLRVAAGGVDVPAEARAREQEPGAEGERQPDEDRVVDAPRGAEAERRPAVRLDRDEVASGDDLGEPVDDDRRRQRGDERVDLPERYEEPVPDPA